MKLKSLDLSSFETNKVIDMEKMFILSSALVSLDLRNFNTSSVPNIMRMFNECTNLKLLNLKSFTYESLSDGYIDDMFNNFNQFIVLIKIILLMTLKIYYRIFLIYIVQMIVIKMKIIKYYNVIKHVLTIVKMIIYRICHYNPPYGIIPAPKNFFYSLISYSAANPPLQNFILNIKMNLILLTIVDINSNSD